MLNDSNRRECMGCFENDPNEARVGEVAVRGLEESLHEESERRADIASSVLIGERDLGE